MSRIRLTWDNASTTIVEQRVYRSTAPLDIDNMPAPLAVLPRRDREYLDSTIEDGLTYYYAVSSVLPDYSELISEEIKVEATPEESDPYWDKVVALLHFDGSDGSTDFTDETGKTWTAVNGAQIDTSQSVFGGASGRIPGGSARISSPYSPDWDFGTGDFTVELWVRFADFTSTCTMVGNYKGAAGLSGWTFQRRSESGGQIQFGYGDSALIMRPWVPSNGVWHHVAVTRQGVNLRIFINGVQQGATATNYTNIIGSDNPMLLGALMYNSAHQQFMNGYIDEMRITKGVARYTENFTPPTKPFPNK